MDCAACGWTNRQGRRFCGQCGAALDLTCPECGAASEPGDRFCGDCGAPLAAATAGVASTAEPSTGAEPSHAGHHERRLVTVLFCDLVGFTAHSENRDPESVREMLGEYFERCRMLIERYGGTVEKFIGDAVMAVWGTPVAREDDPERATRAALAVAHAVKTLGEDLGLEGLAARVGVLTGNAAVDVSSRHAGMVIGDTVNSASRLQSLAQPGTVLVDDSTRRASEAAIAYEDAGTHVLKGKSEPLHAWRALRVVAGVGGLRRGAGLEAPFVGRTHELEVITSASETVLDGGSAQAVTVIGEAGMGKSRLLWEYYKYMDGVRKVVLWHQGRCLSYGDGVAFWALAEMIRLRAGIAEEEDVASARAKLAATLDRYVPNERERRLVEPRLRHLLGLDQHIATDRADLFSGWRLFIERLCEEAPVILAFEDLQWADSGLLEFIDYLLEWSSDRPIFVVALGRPELLDVRPAWADAALTLKPLPAAAMREALEGLVPGLPDDIVRRIVARAEGVPLYAVETVRMLLDRGLIAQEGSRYVLTGELGELEVPETLHALAAARLDGLRAEERALIQDAAVYGQSFTVADVAALAGRSVAEVQRIFDRLVAKQILGYDDDPRSPEHGQHHFLQALLRTTAYSTLSRRERKNLHLAAARHLQEVWAEGAPELAEILAAHFLAAADADPEAVDAPRIRAAACETLADAGQRALSLALGTEARKAFDRAAELATDDATRARMLAAGGRAAIVDADLEGANERLYRAAEMFDGLGEHEEAAKSLTALVPSLILLDHLDEAIDVTRRALAVLTEPTAERAEALGYLANVLMFTGSAEEVLSLADESLSIAEPLQEYRTVAYTFSTVAAIRHRQGRIEEATALIERARDIALAHDLIYPALRATNNVADIALQLDDFAEAARVAEEGVALARARGDRRQEQVLLLMIATAGIAAGNWDALPPLEDNGLPAASEVLQLAYLPKIARVHAGRGNLEGMQRTLELANARAGSRNTEMVASADVARAIILRALGRDAEALDAGWSVVFGGADIANEDRREAYLEAGLAALSLGEEAKARELVDWVNQLPPVFRSPLLRAGAARFAGLLAARHGDLKTAREQLAVAERDLRAIDAPFELAQVLLDEADVLRDMRSVEDLAELLNEARTIFTGLEATPWLERLDALGTLVTA